VYHPAQFNDRLMLGLKGTMSEAELHLIRSRMTAGLRHKAARGELRQGLPVGFDYDADDRVVLAADEAVREAISTVFRRFAELGSARQVVIALREDGLQLPRRRNGHPRITWAPATYGGARSVDQPVLCRRVRVRPYPHRQARCERTSSHRGADAAPRSMVGTDPRPPPRVHQLGNSTRRTPRGCARTGVRPEATAAAPPARAER